MGDLLRLIPQALAALAIVAFFLLAALVIFGTVAACLRTRQPARRPARRRSAGPAAAPRTKPVTS